MAFGERLTVYRICRAKYPKNDGEGAKINGGRWNRIGTAILYCGSTLSLCALEILANSDDLPNNMVSIEINIPGTIVIPAYSALDLPVGWDAAMPSRASKDFGTKWAKSKKSAAISVPSAVVPKERNYLINPLHPDFIKIRFRTPEPFVFDPLIEVMIFERISFL
jgi:RES domain-containing protein